MRYLVAYREHGKNEIAFTEEFAGTNVAGVEKAAETYLRADPRRTVLVATIESELTGSITIQRALVNPRTKGGE